MSIFKKIFMLLINTEIRNCSNKMYIYVYSWTLHMCLDVLVWIAEDECCVVVPPPLQKKNHDNCKIWFRRFTAFLRIQGRIRWIRNNLASPEPDPTIYQKPETNLEQIALFRLICGKIFAIYLTKQFFSDQKIARQDPVRVLPDPK